MPQRTNVWPRRSVDGGTGKQRELTRPNAIVRLAPTHKRSLMPWNPAQHSDDENTRWAWLRTAEWIWWPLFLSQPIVPVLLYFYQLPWVVGVVAAAALVWRILVVPSFVSPTISSIGLYFARLRFVTAPVMAFLLWRQDEPWIAASALLYPLVGTFVIQLPLALAYAPFALTARGQASQIGVVQKRLMAAICRTSETPL